MKKILVYLLFFVSPCYSQIQSDVIIQNDSTLNYIIDHGKQQEQRPRTSRIIDSLRRVIDQTAPEGSWDDERVPIQSVKTAGIQQPEWDRVYRNSDGTSEGVFLYCFDDGPVEEEVFFSIQFPHTWNGPAGGDSTVYAHVHWLHTATDTGGVVWGLEYTWATVSENAAAAASAFGTTTIIYSGRHPISGAAPKDQHLMTNFPGITKADQGWSSMMICRLFRANVAGDNKVGDACVLEIDFHIQKRPRGTRDVYKDN